MSGTVHAGPRSTPHLERRRSRTAAIVKQIESVGPNMAEIARRLGEPKESVSYTFRTLIRKRGYQVLAHPNRGALGLRDAIVIVEIAQRYARRAVEVFAGMEGHWFLHRYMRTVPDGRFVLDFSLPEEHYGEFPRLIDEMKRSGFVKNVVQTLQFSGRRYRPMSAEHFDFRMGRWDFDWNQRGSGPVAGDREKVHRQRFDLVDVAILSHMMTDATKPMNEVAKLMGVSTKTVYRHARHIDECRLVESHGVRWSGLHARSGRSALPSRGTFHTCVTLQEPAKDEAGQLSARLNSIPFLCSELLGRDYFAELLLPTEYVVEGMSFLREALEPVSRKTTSLMVDPGCTATFSPPTKAFDESSGEWVFDVAAQVSRLSDRLRSTGEEPGSPGSPSPLP